MEVITTPVELCSKILQYTTLKSGGFLFLFFCSLVGQRPKIVAIKKVQYLWEPENFSTTHIYLMDEVSFHQLQKNHSRITG